MTRSFSDARRVRELEARGIPVHRTPEERLANILAKAESGDTYVFGEIALPLSHYEAATLCGALAYVSGENDMPPSNDEDVLRDVSTRLQALIRRGGRQ